MYNKIMSEIKEAMKNKETDKKDVLKMAVTKAQAVAKENKCEVTEEIMLDGIKKELKQLKDDFDPSETGGSPFLGISKPVIKAHGSSDARAFRNAVRQAMEAAKADFSPELEQGLSLLKESSND